MKESFLITTERLIQRRDRVLEAIRNNTDLLASDVAFGVMGLDYVPQKEAAVFIAPFLASKLKEIQEVLIENDFMPNEIYDYDPHVGVLTKITT